MKQFLPTSTIKISLLFALTAISLTVYAQPGSVTRVLANTVSQTGNLPTVAWTNISGATNEDGNTATVSVSTANQKKSKVLSITNFGFTLGTNPGDIPSNATISGIVVEIKKKVTGVVKDQAIQLLKNGNVAGGTRNLPGSWPTTLSYTSHGNVSDLWGTTWTPAQLAASNFGVQVQLMNRLKTISIAEVDNIKVTVYYNLNIYYSGATGLLTSPGTWWTNPNGTSGSHPINFTTDGQIFNLVNRTSTTLNADMTISGLFSKMIIGDGVSGTELIIPSTAALTALTDVTNLSTLTIQHTSLPTLGALDINSTVNYNAGGSQDVSEADYGHLAISGTGSKSLLTGVIGASTVSGNLSIGSSSFFTVNSPIYVYGNISNAGSANGTNTITLTGDVTSTLNGGGVYRALAVDKYVDNANGAVLTGNVLINELLQCIDDSISNSSFLIPQNGSTIQIEDGRLLSNITTANTYNVLYTGVTKTSSFETTGPGLNDITLNLDDNTNTFSPSTLTMKGNLLLIAGTFVGGANTINIGGNFTNNAIFIPGTSTVSFINATNSDLNGMVTTAFYNLSINKTASSNYLSLNNDLTVNNQLTLTGGKLMLAAFTLKQAGPIVCTAGFIDGLSGTLDMAGSAAQTIPANCFVNNALANLVINNSSTGVDLAGALDIYNNVSFGNVNSKILTSAGYLTLKSSATNTASLCDLTNNSINSGNAVTGNVTVERYIPAGRKWRFLSVPTTSGQTFKQAWMENNAAGANNNPGYGMMISDNNAATWAANGFDAYSIGGPTVKTYDAASNTWIGISSTANTISNTIGYMTFVRGSRAYATTNTTTSPTVLRTTGVLKQGSQAAIAVATNTMTSVGNPYPAAIDLRKLIKTGVQDIFYVWDPKLGGSYGVGGYQTFSKLGTDYVVTPGGGSYGIGAVQNYIDCGQAFFVKGAAGGTIDFQETAKASVSHDVFRANTADPESFRANLHILTADTVLMADGILVDYQDIYSNAVDYNDALKMANSNENVGLRRDGAMLMIERRYEMANRDTLFLNISGMRVQAYRWIFRGIGIAAAGRVAYLKDNFLGSTTVLDLAGSTTIDFNVTSVAASYAYNRFMIVFEQAGVVPVTITSISASRNYDKTISVNWHVENEIAIEKYEVERSADAGNFQMINKALPTTAAYGNYQFTDKNPINADNFYRIKATSQSGLVQYSAIVKVNAIVSDASVSVYPTMVSDKKLNIAFTAVEKTSYSLQVVNVAGQVVYKNNILVNTANLVKTIELGATNSGIYTVVISNENGFKNSNKIVVE